MKNVTIRHKNQILYGETSYPATGGYVYASSYFAGDVNQGTIDITCSGELVGGTNSREDLDGLGSMYESTWDIQPYVGELCISTLTLNGEALSPPRWRSQHRKNWPKRWHRAAARSP